MIALARYTHWCNSDIDVMGVTNNFLIRFKSNSKKWNSCLVLAIVPNTRMPPARGEHVCDILFRAVEGDFYVMLTSHKRSEGLRKG